MKCAVFDHYLKIQATSEVAACCTMKGHPWFGSIDALYSSQWYADTKLKFDRDEWPPECVRCQVMESDGHVSRRIGANARVYGDHTVVPDGYWLDVNLNHVCNAACPMCSEQKSSMISGLKGIPVREFSSLSVLRALDYSKIFRISLSGGETSVGKTSEVFLEEVRKMPNLASLEMVTNGGRPIPKIREVLALGKPTSVLLSMDGIGSSFEYSRWPIKWDDFVATSSYYKDLRNEFSNLRLSISAVITVLNIDQVTNIRDFAKEYDFGIAILPLSLPSELAMVGNNVVTRAMRNCKMELLTHELTLPIATDEYDNTEELRDFITRNDQLRGISIWDYLPNVASLLYGIGNQKVTY